MWKIRQEIVAAGRRTGTSVVELDPTIADEIRSQILSKFTTGLSAWPAWIWEHLGDRATFVDSEGWKAIGEFAPETRTVLLTNPLDERAAFEFPNGEAATAVLAECIGFEVYFTDRDVSYLLIHNHHDCVVACGEAKNWLEQRGEAST